MTIFKWIAILLVTVYCAGLVVLYVRQRGMLFPIPTVARTAPDAAGLPEAEEHILTTSDDEAAKLSTSSDWRTTHSERAPRILKRITKVLTILFVSSLYYFINDDSPEDILEYKKFNLNTLLKMSGFRMLMWLVSCLWLMAGDVAAQSTGVRQLRDMVKDGPGSQRRGPCRDRLLQRAPAGTDRLRRPAR